MSRNARYGGKQKKDGGAAGGKNGKATKLTCSRCMHPLALQPGGGYKCTNDAACGREISDGALRAEMSGRPANTGQKKASAGKSAP